MIIQNRKTGERQNVTAEAWKTLTDVGFAKHWQVLSKEDPPPMEDAKALPLEIKEFSKIETKKKTKNAKRKNS